MRILVVGYSKTPYKNDRVGGGAQQVEKNQLRLLGRDHEIYYLTGSDSDDVDLPRVTTIHFNVPSKSSPDYTRSMSRSRNDELYSLIEAIKPEFILTNDETNQGVIKLLTQTSIPSLLFIHSSIYVSGGPGMIGYLETLHNFHQAGHTICHVSDVSRLEWATQITKSRKYLSFDTRGIEMFPEYMWPAVMWDKPRPQKEEHGFVVIGRLDKFKNYKTGFAAAPSDLVLFCPSPKNDKERDLLHDLMLRDDQVMFDKSHEEIMDYLAKSKGLLVLGPESFGLTAFEANCRGVPVILVTNRMRHPVAEFCYNFTMTDKKGLVDYLTYMRLHPQNFRSKEKTIDVTWDSFNYDVAYSDLSNLLDKTITKFNQNPKVSNSSLDQFL